MPQKLLVCIPFGVIVDNCLEALHKIQKSFPVAAANSNNHAFKGIAHSNMMAILQPCGYLQVENLHDQIRLAFLTRHG